MTSAWSQLEQLLTCCVCLDRFRNPKLLPCQHTFCAEPCLEGLVDYARRQIKCPECRAEHRIPYNGVQSFPNNVTLARFLDLHRGVTGEEPEPLPSQMDRCGVCSEKAFCERCAHCDKKVCEECKEAHIEILTREISRINNQVRRGLNKLTEHSQQTGRNNEKLQLNHKQIREEITESVRRFIKDLKDKESKLLHDLDEYTQTEAKNVEKLKEDLDQEVVNITSNCELVEKHVTENDDWSAAELVEYKEIFLKTLEFLRNLDPDTSDFARKIKFQYKTDMDVLRRSLIDFGELKITTPNMLLSPSESGSNLNALGLSNQNNLMRSQSDHRLAAQFQQRRQGESRYLDVSGSQSRLTSVVHSDSERDSRLERNSSPTRRATDRYGRYGTDRRETADESSRSRYLREADLYVRNWPRPSDSEEPVTIAPATQFRSRFMRERNNQQEYSVDDSHDSDFGSSHRSVRFEEPAPQPRPKVFETEGAARGPLSGVIKLTDSPHVMERLHQNEIKQKLKEQEAKNPPPAPQPPPPVSTPVTQQPRRAPSRQVSEDEIEKQKKMNQAAAATNTTPAVVPQSPVVKVPQSPPISESPNRIINRRVTTLQREDERVNRYSSDSSRRGSDSSLNIDDSQLDEESGDTSGIARLARRRVGSNNEESDTTSRATTARQPSSPRQVSSTPSTPSSPSTTTTTTTPTSTTITCATTPSTITTSTTSIPTTTCSTSTTSTTYVERKEEPVVKKDSTALKFRIVSKALTSPSNSLQSNNSIENETESSTRLSDLYSSRTSAKSPYVRQSSDVRFDKPTNSSLTGYSPLLSSTSRRSPTPTYVNSSTNHKASDASTNLLYPTSSSIASRDNSRSGSPELRRVNLADFRGQERPNYNPYRQARPNLSLNYTMPITREEPLIRTSYTPTTSTLTSIPQQSSYRHTLSSLGFPDSSNEREIITQSFDWGISVLDYICYSIGFIIFITVIIYRSVRSPLGKNLSLTHPEVNDVNSDNKNIVRHTIGSDKKDSRTVSTSDSSESNASNDSSGETDSESDEEDISAAIDTNRSNTTAVNETQHRSERIIELPASVSSLLNRSAQARKDNLNAINRTDSPTGGIGGIGGIGSSGQGIGRFSRQSTLNDETNTERPTYKGRKPLEPSKKEEDNSPSYQPKRNISRGSTLEDDDDQPNTTANSTYSRFLSRSRTSAAIANKEDSQVDDSKYSYARRSDKSGSSTSPSNASTYRSRLAKSRSSHSIQGYEDSDEENVNPISPSYKSKYGDSALANRRTSRSGYTYRTREPEEPAPEEETGSVAQYLINKYGTKPSSSKSDPSRSIILKSKSSHAIYGRSISSSDDETPSTTTSTPYRKSSRDNDSFKPSSFGLTYPRQMYLQKKKMMMKIGSRGTEPGCFTWPRGVAVGPDNSIVVADSSNHRVQVFDSTGRFKFEFGSYGSADGEFDCLAGVAVNRIGQFVVSDRYNHRIQLFDPNGRFLRTFGCEGRTDGRFSYPWGITTDPLGFIYVCDKENHRIQVFQSDGTFVGKFGTIGSRTGMLEHPHYITVSNTNRVIVSDSNNHRIQIFDVNGRSLSTFGSEGSSDGQFKFPRGVAVDDQGFIMVGDSGNNRVQIFNPDGTFLKSFGTWGSGDGEFKGLEGVAITSTGNILVCDRENHRIQIF